MAATKSLTALPSVVSVVAEKTVIAMRCHTRGFEKVFWPITSIVLTSVALACFAVAAGTPMWVQINLTDPTSATDQDKGYITFGIFSGSHSIELQRDTVIGSDTDSYNVFERYTSILISRLYATFAFSLIAMVLCVLLIVVTFLNSYQTVTTWWKGPPMMYILSFFISFSAFIALGLFADFYLWDMDTRSLFIDSYTIPGDSSSNLLSYTRTPTLHYSFGLHCGGSFLPVIVLLISWRLVLLLPTKKEREDEPEETELEQTSPMMGTAMMGTTILPTSNMMLSMQSAAGAPPIMASGSEKSGRSKKTSKASHEGEGGMLY